MFSSSATTLCMAMFCCASADYDCVEHLVSVLYSEYRTVLKLRKIGVFRIRVRRKSCENRALDLMKIGARSEESPEARPDSLQSIVQVSSSTICSTWYRYRYSGAMLDRTVVVPSFQ